MKCRQDKPQKFSLPHYYKYQNAGNDGGTSDIKTNSAVSVSVPTWLRVGRTGDTWVYSYSLDGSNWITAVAFNQVLTVTEVGPFVGNFGSAPAHTALVDYFFNTSSPISPEDSIVPGFKRKYNN